MCPPELFGFAGLWDIWKKPDGTLLESFTIATCAPNELMRGNPRSDAGDHPAQG
jgi:hypothetical protein